MEKQPDSLPTNKAMAVAAIVPTLLMYMQPIIIEVWPMYAPASIAGPAFASAAAGFMSGIVGLAVAWWVPDRAGVATTR